MARTVKQIPLLQKQKHKLNVAAYARVSVATEDTIHSLRAQIDYYTNYISANPEWVFAGLFYDEGISGRTDRREGLQKMLQAARNGSIDLILVKSISRLARNTVVLLETVRELKGLGVDIYFEEQNIHSISSDGEIMLTIIASYAQAESMSIGENVAWGIRKQFEKGRKMCGEPYGYKLVNGRYQLNPAEAPAVKMMFEMYLSGMNASEVARSLNEKGIRTKKGCLWCSEAVLRTLSNYEYTGNMVLQKYYVNPLSKKLMINNGELPQYHVESSHPAIVSQEMFDAVQKIRTQRSPARKRSRQ